MTPNEKALSLLSKHRTIIRIADKYDHNLSSDEIYLAKQSALLCISEILQIVPSIYVTKDEEVNSGHYQYWAEVKSEIEKL